MLFHWMLEGSGKVFINKASLNHRCALDYSPSQVLPCSNPNHQRMKWSHQQAAESLLLPVKKKEQDYGMWLDWSCWGLQRDAVKQNQTWACLAQKLANKDVSRVVLRCTVLYDSDGDASLVVIVLAETLLHRWNKGVWGLSCCLFHHTCVELQRLPVHTWKWCKSTTTGFQSLPKQVKRAHEHLFWHSGG